MTGTAVGPMQALAPGSSSTRAPPARAWPRDSAWTGSSFPGDLVDVVVAAKVLADRQSSFLDQLTLAEFIASGAYDRHVRRSRLSYRRRRDRLVAEVQRLAPHVRISGIAAGLHAVLDLTTGQQEEELVARAVCHGLAIRRVGFLRCNGTTPPWRPRGGLRDTSGTRLHRSAGAAVRRPGRYRASWLAGSPGRRHSQAGCRQRLMAGGSRRFGKLCSGLEDCLQLGHPCLGSSRPRSS